MPAKKSEKQSPVKIQKGIAVPPSKQGGEKPEKYPWAEMEIGDSFLIPVTEDMPKPWIKRASTVSSASARYAKKKKADRRRFILRRVFAGQKHSNGYTETTDGARVFRIS
jgi:hypothetical protein